MLSVALEQGLTCLVREICVDCKTLVFVFCSTIASVFSIIICFGLRTEIPSPNGHVAVVISTKLVSLLRESSSLSSRFSIENLDHALLKLDSCKAHSPALFVIDFNAVLTIQAPDMVLDLLGFEVHELVNWDHILDVT